MYILTSMTIYRIHPDHLVYQLLSLPADEVEEKLGEESMFHFDRRPKPYANEWKVLDVTFYGIGSRKSKLLIPDITIEGGRLFLNQTACNSLRKLIEMDGEILPIRYDDKDGFIVNPLKVAEEIQAFDQKHSIRNESGELDALTFHENKLTDTCIFRSKFDTYLGVFCNEEFKDTVESLGLKGINFSEDLANIFPPDPSAQSPIKH